jgi:alpha-ketoglutarate-dependent taurine dioxygenase
MNAAPLSDLFDGGGAAVTPDAPDQKIGDLPFAEVVSLFRTKGVLLFRGFDLEPRELSQTTARFTKKYAPDALRRSIRFGQRAVRDVDGGEHELPLHSEASFSAAWPEIVWFYCNVAPRQGGETKLCDGARLWENVSEATRRFFSAQPLRYRVGMKVAEPLPGGRTEPWPWATPEVEGEMDWEHGIARLTVLRHAMQPTRASRDKLALANHLMAGEPQVESVAMADGTTIPREIVAELVERSDRITHALSWQERDLVMVDNRRFLHARHAYTGPRDVVQIQSHQLAFD